MRRTRMSNYDIVEWICGLVMAMMLALLYMGVI
jgi:hypothetical protein